MPGKIYIRVLQLSILPVIAANIIIGKPCIFPNHAKRDITNIILHKHVYINHCDEQVFHTN